MPKYYFNTSDQGDSPDIISLPDLTAARRHAVTMALELLWESPYRLHANPEWVVTVKGEDGNSLLSVSLFEALGQEPEIERLGSQLINPSGSTLRY